ncbi:hypothetical protein [Alkalicella caledoniensis]|nr:hypothetical protein [Alkalicella caledoniensis]
MYWKRLELRFYGMGGSVADENGLCYFPELEGKLPMILSLKAEKK